VREMSLPESQTTTQYRPIKAFQSGRRLGGCLNRRKGGNHSADRTKEKARADRERETLQKTS